MTTTEIYNIELPSRGVPAPNINRTKGVWDHYDLPDMTNVSKPKQSYQGDYALTHTFDSPGELRQFVMNQTITGIAMNPSLLREVRVTGSRQEVASSISQVSRKITEHSESGRLREWGHSIREWFQSLEFGYVSMDDVPEVLKDAVNQYVSLRAAYGIKLDRELSNRIVYNKTTNTVSNTGLVYDDGSRKIITSLRTGKMEYAKTRDAISCYNIVTGDKILAPGSKNWLALPESLQLGSGVAAGMIHSHQETGTTQLIKFEESASNILWDTARQIHSVIAQQQGAVDNRKGFEVRDVVSLAKTTHNQDVLKQMFTDHADVWTDEATQAGWSQLQQ